MCWWYWWHIPPCFLVSKPCQIFPGVQTFSRKSLPWNSSQKPTLWIACLFHPVGITCVRTLFFLVRRKKSGDVPNFKELLVSLFWEPKNNVLVCSELCKRTMSTPCCGLRSPRDHLPTNPVDRVRCLGELEVSVLWSTYFKLYES